MDSESREAHASPCPIKGCDERCPLENWDEADVGVGIITGNYQWRCPVHGYFDEDHPPMVGEHPDGFDPGRIGRLYKIHIARYENRRRHSKAGHSGYNRMELEHLIELWRSVRDAGFDYNRLSAGAADEVRDAIEDEDDEKAYAEAQAATTQTN